MALAVSELSEKRLPLSILTHTIFENTKYPLRTWYQVAYLMSQSKKGISALQIHRQIGSGSYETAWLCAIGYEQLCGVMYCR